MEFVLDNSVSLRWCLPSAKKADQDYAAWVLSTAFVSSAAVVPGIWHLEVANTLRRAEKFGELSEGQSDTFIRRLEALPISADPDTVREAMGRTLTLARRHNLSSYDAAYLELAERMSIPLATLDKDIKRAMQRDGVELLSDS